MSNNIYDITTGKPITDKEIRIKKMASSDWASVLSSMMFPEGVDFEEIECDTTVDWPLNMPAPVPLREPDEDEEVETADIYWVDSELEANADDDAGYVARGFLPDSDVGRVDPKHNPHKPDFDIDWVDFDDD